MTEMADLDRGSAPAPTPTTSTRIRRHEKSGYRALPHAPAQHRARGPDTGRSVDGGRRTVAYWIYEPVQVTAETRTILVMHGFRGDHHGLLRVADQLPGCG